MSPAPETVRRPANSSASNSPSLSISTILSRAPRAPNESPAGGSPFSADRRATSSIHRYFSGPRPAPFQRQTVTLSEPASTRQPTDRETSPTPERDSPPSTALLLSALETRRRRIEELRNRQTSQTASNIATTIAEQWRRQQDTLTSLQTGFRPVSSTTRNNLTPSPEIGQTTPPQWPSPPRLFLGEESESDSDSDDDDDPDNKFATSMNDVRRTPPPTFLTPNTSPSNQSTGSPSSQQDDDSSRNAYTLSCRFCANVLTKRGMRARLVADARVHIWSTDEQPNVKLVGDKYATTTCQCQLIDIACARCETVVGYHIAGSKPCDTCSRSNHNAHYHLLRTNRTIGIQNLNMEGQPMSWGDITSERKDI